MELVKALAAKFPQPVTSAVTGYVTNLLNEHAANPANNWKQKERALDPFLVYIRTINSSIWRKYGP